jgi:hypothetical protein
MEKTKVLNVTYSTWEAMEGRRPMGVPVAVRYQDGSKGYAWCLDGWGSIWYETLDELLAEHC